MWEWRCLSRHLRVSRFGDGDVITVRIGDHQGLDPRARRAVAHVHTQLLRLRQDLAEAADRKGEGSLASALGGLIHLQPTAARELPWMEIAHVQAARDPSWCSSGKSIPDDSRQRQ